MEDSTPFGMIFGSIAVVVVLILLFMAATIIDQTERGVVTRFGVVQTTLEPGFHFVNPFTTDVNKFQVSTQKIEVEATAASKDLQDVTSKVAVQYNLDASKVGDIYSQYRNSVRDSVIDPAIQDSIKAGTASFNAEALITQRAQVKETIEKALRERLGEAHVVVTNVDIINFNFSQSFNNAIEAKVTAEQEAQKAKNDLERVKFEAEQRVAQAEAEAEAIRIQAEAVTSQGGKDYVQLKAIEKWNGQLPNQFVPGSAVPFLNLTN